MARGVERHRMLMSASGRRCGFTLVELLTASIITALVATAAATLISASTNATLSVGDIRDNTTAGNYALSRIASSIRKCRGIGGWNSTSVSLWVADRNNDDQMTVNETGMIEYVASSRQIVYREWTGSSGVSVSTAEFTNLVTFQVKTGSTSRKDVVWAEGVDNFSLYATPAVPNVRLVEVYYTMGSGPGYVQFTTSASLRASADYLMTTGGSSSPPSGSSRKRRTGVAAWGG